MEGESAPEANTSPETSTADKRIRRQPGEDGTQRRKRLCALQLVEVARNPNDFQILVTSRAGRRVITISDAEAAQFVKELESACLVIRSQI